MNIGTILAAREAASEKVHRLDLGDGQILLYKVPDTREMSFRNAAIEAAFRNEMGVGNDAVLHREARLLVQCYALNGLVLVGWEGIPGPDGKPFPFEDEDGHYLMENGDRLLSIDGIGLRLLLACTDKMNQALKESAEAKKASSPRSKRRRGTGQGGKRSAPGRNKTRNATPTAKQKPRKSSILPSASGN